MQGFFSDSELTQFRRPLSLIPKCGSCGLKKTCKTPVMPVSGNGRRKILIVGEAPGEDEDEKGRQFVGKTGRILQAALAKAGIDMREDCWLTNSLVCHPENNKIGDMRRIDYCRPILTATVAEKKPEVIILVGAIAVRSFIHPYWKEKEGQYKITRWKGWKIPLQKTNCWVCPIVHPSYVSREDNPVLTREFERHIKEAVSLKGRPWKEVPDYKSEVEIVLDDDAAAEVIKKMNKEGNLIAYDYETNMKKCDSSISRIFSCSISDGKKTIAFPWRANARSEMRGILKNPSVRKMASNLQFEDRWTRKEFGFGVAGWYWDTVIGAHTLDNRAGIAGLKFQSLVLLGQESYDDHISPMLKSKEQGGYALNRIQDIKMEHLLLYNGLDSILEYEVAVRQMRQLKIGGIDDLDRNR